MAMQIKFRVFWLVRAVVLSTLLLYNSIIGMFSLLCLNTVLRIWTSFWSTVMNCPPCLLSCGGSKYHYSGGSKKLTSLIHKFFLKFIDKL